jgi:hypothetical protein
MADCTEISPLLGAFEDGELQTREIQEVAYHLARCDSCSAELADLTSVGNELRASFLEPDLSGFKRAVMNRIEELPQPFMTRLRNFFARTSQRLSGGFAMGAAMAAVAAITTIVVMPYAQQFSMRHLAQPIRELATVTHLPPETAPLETASAIPDSALSRATDVMAEPMHEIASVTHLAPDTDTPQQTASAISDDALTLASSSHAVISRLESQDPNVAVWSEPQNDTTVIWLPDQQQ